MEKILVLISLFFCNSFNCFSQSESKISSIIDSHFRSTTKNTSWENLISFSMSGKMNYENGGIITYSVMRKWPNLIRIELLESASHSTIYENEDEIVVIKNGEKNVASKTNFHTSENIPVITQFNYSYALTKVKSNDILAKFLGDTTIRERSFHIIKLQERKLDPLLFLIDKETFYLKYVMSTSKEFNTSIEFNDFRWVNGFLFPFKETHFRFSQYHFTQFVEKISINSLKDKEFLED